LASGAIGTTSYAMVLTPNDYEQLDGMRGMKKCAREDL
jgi:hypothetical protein